MVPKPNRPSWSNCLRISFHHRDQLKNQKACRNYTQHWHQFRITYYYIFDHICNCIRTCNYITSWSKTLLHNMIHHPVSACTCNTSGLTHAWQSKRGPGRCGHTGKYHQGRPPYLQPGFCECKMFHGFTGDSPVLSHLDGSNDVFILIFIGVLKARLNPFDSIWAKGKPSMYINVIRPWPWCHWKQTIPAQCPATKL